MARHGLVRRLQIAAGMAGEPAQQRAQILAAAFAEIIAAALRVPPAAASRPRRAAHRRGPRPATPRARCRARAPAPTAARCRISTNRGRRADAPQSPWHARRRDRSTDRPTSDGAGRADARAARSAARRAPPPTRRPAPVRSLSANDSIAMSPGGWPRSTASTISSRSSQSLPAGDASLSRCLPARAVIHSARVTAARSSPFSPITTSRPSRASAAAQGRSY